MINNMRRFKKVPKSSLSNDKRRHANEISFYSSISNGFISSNNFVTSKFEDNELTLEFIIQNDNQGIKSSSFLHDYLLLGVFVMQNNILTLDSEVIDINSLKIYLNKIIFFKVIFYLFKYRNISLRNLLLLIKLLILNLSHKILVRKSTKFLIHNDLLTNRSKNFMITNKSVYIIDFESISKGTNFLFDIVSLSIDMENRELDMNAILKFILIYHSDKEDQYIKSCLSSSIVHRYLDLKKKDMDVDYLIKNYDSYILRLNEFLRNKSGRFGFYK